MCAASVTFNGDRPVARQYAIYDVFTDRKLAGNPLAVIFDGAGLSDEMMQTIAGEMNLSGDRFRPARRSRIAHRPDPDLYPWPRTALCRAPDGGYRDCAGRARL